MQRPNHEHRGTQASCWSTTAARMAATAATLGTLAPCSASPPAIHEGVEQTTLAISEPLAFLRTNVWWKAHVPG
eukprot:12608339-Alexandrium_andersonii.AAC.1